ncbi:hypothetical protein [Maritimibacter sp. DP1N21-5]|uniref:hypothetical protein n=1 Tax=Maritimibacter sp. DP1N21-5 TaxID=2836867 RepID=UPI001C453800|nr:hypothetical protein [Maritimibacter sp. DP1N21-5]MBV7409153.1 hypothetical protein [Maritimibacter sp. DP1N21-5]
MDREGRILAVNGEALTAFGTSEDGALGTNVTTLFQDMDRPAAQSALDDAFSGAVGRFLAVVNGVEWAVECHALRDGDHMGRALVLSRRAEPGTDHDSRQEGLRRVRHSLTNMVSASASAARMVRRGVEGDRADALAQELEEAAERAMSALDTLKVLLDGSTDTEDRSR